jgi:hypothetical protein
MGKEPTFFNWPFQYVRNPIEYFKMFDSSKPYRMDASVAYLCNPATPPILRSLFPEARFIVSVRDPKARAYSLYRNNRLAGWEDIEDFSKALQAEADRYKSVDFWQSCRWDFWTYLYCRSSLYDEQLSRYFAQFNRDQFHIISLAELSRDPLATTESILSFLGLDPMPAKHFKFEVHHRIEHTRAPYSAEADAIMSLSFNGLIDRTELLIGRSLDWSL